MPDRIRSMTKFQILSVHGPFDNPDLASAAAGALSRADAMGLLDQPVTCLDKAAIQALLAGMSEAGIGRNVVARLQRLQWSDLDKLSSELERVSEALEQSPAPEREWRILQRILGLDLLARLVGISQSSARRYLSGTRSTPDAVAARLHHLALIVGDLSGAYNDIGVRRWFDRRRVRLAGSTPAQALGDAWSPEEDGPRSVRELAGALAVSPAA